MPHIGHHGNPATHKGQRDKHRQPNPKRETLLVHSRSIRPNQPGTPPPPYATPTVPATTPKRHISCILDASRVFFSGDVMFPLVSMDPAPCPRCGAATTSKARGRPRPWCSDRCRKLASEEHRAAARGAVGLEIRDWIIERRIPEVVHRPPSITASIALLLADVAASKKVLNTLARRDKRDQLDRATIKLLWPHIHELYTEARPRMGLPERPTTVRTMTPAECAERVLGWPHTGVQVINGLTAKALRGHLTPSEQRDLRIALNHLHDALTTTPGGPR